MATKVLAKILVLLPCTVTVDKSLQHLKHMKSFKTKISKSMKCDKRLLDIQEKHEKRDDFIIRLQ